GALELDDGGTGGAGEVIVCVRDPAAFADRASCEGVVLPDRLQIVEDDPGLAGPVAGLVAGLAAVPYGVVVAVAADLPFVDSSLLAGLLDALDASPSADAVVPIVDGRDQPLCAAYRASAVETARGLGSRSPVGERDDARGPALADLLAALAVRRLSSVGSLGPEELAVMCRGIDSPDDLRWAESRVRDARRD
ncbi:MAG: NTP transferase domain-containing protein, partial [Gemmatimonadota bacterium]|nr:NTP transferase domain-containing protein [Gemmatimonadota bacterium]